MTRNASDTNDYQTEDNGPHSKTRRQIDLVKQTKKKREEKREVTMGGGEERENETGRRQKGNVCEGVSLTKNGGKKGARTILGV